MLDKQPIKQVKEGRKLDSESVVKVLEDQQKLFEVTGDELPHILTNNPTFFTSNKSEEISQEDRGTANTKLI